MSRRRTLAWLLGLPLAAYALVATGVCLRAAWRPEPTEAGLAFLRAVQQRDAPGIYLYSDLLGAQLAGMASRSGMSADDLRHLQAKDYARWKAEFDRGERAMDSMRRECDLIRPGASIEPVAPAEYKAEVADGDEANLESYVDLPGELYHRYVRLAYRDPASAPEVGLLDNVKTGKQRRLRELVLRLEVKRRPELGGLRGLVVALDWLDELAFLVPFRGLIEPVEPSAAWAVNLAFAVDKTTLATF